MKLGRFSVHWQSKKDLSPQWRLDNTPTGAEEEAAFRDPSELQRVNTRDGLEDFDYRQDIIQKRKFAGFSYHVAYPWAATLILVVIAQGWEGGWHLEPAEFIAVVTTTTGSVFGFAYVLGRYLFGSKAYRSHTAAGDSVAPDKKPAGEG